MENKVFENQIEPLLNVVNKSCEKEGIGLFIQAQIDNSELYDSRVGDIILDKASIITQIQLWEARNKTKFFNDSPIKNDKENNINDEVYKDEGMAIFVKGKMVIGIHPDNLENNLEALANGHMGFDWKILAENSGIKINEDTDEKDIFEKLTDWIHDVDKMQKDFTKRKYDIDMKIKEINEKVKETNNKNITFNINLKVDNSSTKENAQELFDEIAKGVKRLGGHIN